MYTSALSYRVTDVSSIGSLFEISAPFCPVPIFSLFFYHSVLQYLPLTNQSGFFFPIVSLLFTQQPVFFLSIYMLLFMYS